MIFRKPRVALALGLFAAFYLFAVQPSAQLVNQKIDPEVLTGLEQTGQVTFFVLLQEQADVSTASTITDWNLRGQVVVDSLKGLADRTQRPILDLLTARGAEVAPFWIVNTIRVTTNDRQLIQLLAALPEVAAIESDKQYPIPDPIPATTEPTIQAVEWGVDRVRAPDVWAEFGVRGEGIVVANIDTGVQYDHPALVMQYRGRLEGGGFDHNYNWHDPSLICGNPSLVPCDNNRHGTHTMGTSVGDDGNPGPNQIGVAPRAKWIAAKGCESGLCSRNALLSSGQWVLAPTDLNGANPRPDLRPHIVNNSWGGGTTDPWYRATVQNWRNAGIFPAFASGNPGSGCGLASVPGAYPESFGVGATDINDIIASFSGRGPANAFGGITKPNVSAPGVNVRSSVSIPPNGYQALSGTSMATPHVAGVVALLWSLDPSLRGDIARTENLLQSTARFRSSTQCGSDGPPNNVYGWGIVDALAAARATTPTTTLTVSPTSVPQGGAVTANWAGIPSASATDWIGLFAPDVPDTSFLEWMYVSCSQTPDVPRPSGTCSFGIPGDLPPGTYELQLFADNGFTRLARSNTFTVTASTTRLAVSPTSMPRGGNVTATWSGIPSPSATDWRGLYTGSPNPAFLEWIYVSRSQTPTVLRPSGSYAFTIPGSVAPGTYQLRLLSNNAFTGLATSNNFTVTL